MKRICLVISALVLLASSGCKQHDSAHPQGAIARVGDNYITHEDVSKILHDGMSYGSDSLLMAKRIVESWVDHELYSLVASKNIPNLEKIEEKVREYRHSLLIHEYIKQMIAGNEKIMTDIPQDSVEEFYNRNKSQFTLKTPIIKGVIVRVDNREPELAAIKRWMKRGNSSDVENIEKSALKSTVSYQYFHDSWADWNRIASLLPKMDDKIDLQSSKNSYIELADNNYTYLLKISDYRKKGELMPMDFAESNIREIFVMTNQQIFEKELRKSLIEEALEDNTLQFYDSTMIKNI